MDDADSSSPTNKQDQQTVSPISGINKNIKKIGDMKKLNMKLIQEKMIYILTWSQGSRPKGPIDFYLRAFTHKQAHPSPLSSVSSSPPISSSLLSSSYHHWHNHHHRMSCVHFTGQSRRRELWCFNHFSKLTPFLQWAISKIPYWSDLSSSFN